MFNYIILFLLAAWIVYIVALYIIYKSDRLYCFIYEHKDYKLWNKICKHLKEAKLIKYSEDNDGTAIYFNFRLTIDSVDYDIIYWCENNIVSVHCRDKCVLSDFDKYHSDKAAEIIRKHLL